MLKIFKENKYEFSLLMAAVLFVAGSVWGSIEHPKGNWFCRSGAIMVLLAVMVEYHIGKMQQEENESAQLFSAFEIPVSGSLPKAKKYLSGCAHLFAIAGTVIWGYGDLVI